ncbi:MAG: DNA-binding response regulator [Runella slithyformis]|nr:MAG: DNA-binding response regulator [Runella slithyformis]TAF28591.1 MAG: DNA-binding response regulator [Runella slithyformis]TAF47618.1 MAG: DNA-binding response regulator [Runella slithyformis]
MKKLLIVDDHPIFAEGLRFLLESTTAYQIAGVLHKGQQVTPFLARTPIDVLLLDIQMPDISGFEVAEKVKKLYPKIKILALSMLGDKHSVHKMLEAGAAGYCIKNTSTDELMKAIKNVSENGNYLPNCCFQATTKNTLNAVESPLTCQETKIMKLITAGRTTNQIATQLFVSVRTVETHRKNIYRKLGVHTNVELTNRAQKMSLI